MDNDNRPRNQRLSRTSGMELCGFHAASEQAFIGGLRSKRRKRIRWSAPT
jgi:hypothetical protein